VGPIDVVRVALSEIGQQISIQNFSDTSPAGTTARLQYDPKIRTLLRAANWGFARAQIPLTLWKSATVNGVASGNPPPAPYLYEYEYPNDCLKLRFLLPTANAPSGGVPLTTGMTGPFAYPGMPTDIPFVDATDFDDRGNIVRVVLTNLAQAQAIYVRDLSQFPDTWDPQFLSAATALLAAYFINALARNTAQMNSQIALAKSMIDSARVSNANEAITSADHQPDWMRARRGMRGTMFGMTPANGAQLGSFDSVPFPDGSSY
jgi:hypothetical protein